MATILLPPYNIVCHLVFFMKEIKGTKISCLEWHDLHTQFLEKFYVDFEVSEQFSKFQGLKQVTLAAVIVEYSGFMMGNMVWLITQKQCIELSCNRTYKSCMSATYSTALQSNKSCYFATYRFLSLDRSGSFITVNCEFNLTWCMVVEQETKHSVSLCS